MVLELLMLGWWEPQEHADVGRPRAPLGASAGDARPTFRVREGARIGRGLPTLGKEK